MPEDNCRNEQQAEQGWAAVATLRARLIRELKAECSRLRERLSCARCGADSSTLDAEHHCSTCYAEAQATITRLRERVRVLEEALEWYADESNYDSDHAPGTPEPNVPRGYAGWDADCGDRARNALAKGGE